MPDNPDRGLPLFLLVLLGYSGILRRPANGDRPTVSMRPAHWQCSPHPDEIAFHSMCERASNQLLTVLCPCHIRSSRSASPKSDASDRAGAKDDKEDKAEEDEKDKGKEEDEVMADGEDKAAGDSPAPAVNGTDHKDDDDKPADDED